MKKIAFVFLYFTFINVVIADTNNDITADTEVNFKWYQEEISESLYYPKKESLPDYKEDINNLQYGEYSDWSLDYCDYPKEYYLVEEKTYYTYEKVAKSRYVWLIPTSAEFCNNNSCIGKIVIYDGKNTISYNKIQDVQTGIMLDLLKEYDTENLWFYIEASERYAIYLSNVRGFETRTISYHVIREKVLIPDSFWIGQSTTYIEETSENEIVKSPFIKNIQIAKVCRVSEIKTYRYKTRRKYYDNNYHLYINGYLPDIEDYKVIYLKSFSAPICETNEVSIPVTNTKENKICNNVTEEKIIYKDKIVFKVPIKIYLLLLIMMMIIIRLLIKKYVD